MRISDWSSDVCSSDLSPATAGAEYIAITESATGGEAVKVGKRVAAGEQVAHMDIHRGEAGAIERRSHFGLTVDTLLAQYRDARSRVFANGCGGDVVLGINAEHRHQAPITKRQSRLAPLVGAAGFV